MDTYGALLQVHFLGPDDIAHIIWAAEGVKPASGLAVRGISE